jgi:predicted permease
MSEVLVRAFSLILIMFSGYIIKRIGWVGKEHFSIFSKIVLRYTLPCAIITSFNSMQVDTTLLIYTIIGVGINVIAATVGYMTGRAKGRREQAFHILNTGSFNIGAFTLPYISSFLGAEGVVRTSLFDVGNSIGAAGINYSLAKSLADETKKITLLGIMKNMLTSVIFCTYLGMFLLRLLDISFPTPVITFTGIVGQANTFLAMLMIGIGFELNIDRRRLRKVITILGSRYLITSSVILLIYLFLPIPIEGKRIFSIVLFSPIAAMTAGFTQEIDGDVTTSSFMTSLSTIISIIIITSLLVITS